MGFFDDDVYTNLDWLSQATTPLVFSGNTILGDLPDKIEVSHDEIRKNLGVHGRLSISDFVKTLIGRDHGLHSSVVDLIEDCYNFQCEGDTTVDPQNGIFPAIQVLKVRPHFSEKEIISYVQDRLRWLSGGEDIGRINEILDLLDYTPKDNGQNLRASRSVKKKMKGVIHVLENIFASNKWQIRDADLMVSFVHWVEQYIQDGNLAALTNITKLKIMTHKKQPIYSIKEAT